MDKKQYIELGFIIDIENLRKSLDKWLHIREKYEEGKKFDSEELFNQYLPIVKPIIHRFTLVTEKYPPSQYGLFSNLNEDQNCLLKKIFLPLEPYEILTNKTSSISIFVPQNIENQRKYPEIYKLNLKEKPINDQLQWWKNTMNIDPIEIESIVVKGKGEGAESLGMPTANIQVSPQDQKKISSYPNGVYKVQFSFIETGSKYKGAACLGTNPHYQNMKQSRRIEVYVINDFEKQFYGEKVAIKLQKLIRFEGLFHSFDAFLNAMHNDIETIKDIDE